MDEGYIDIPVDAGDPSDTPAADGDTGTDSGAVSGSAGDSDGSSGDSGIGDIIKDILDDYFGADQTETDGVEESGETAGEDAGTDPEAAEDAGLDILPDAPENAEAAGADSEALYEIRDTLREHTDSVNGFMSTVTVSGNMVQVSLDDTSSSLLAETAAAQHDVLSALDGLTGLITLVFFVLAFDLLHRSAKRIIKNFMGGERNGTNS